MRIPGRRCGAATALLLAALVLTGCSREAPAAEPAGKATPAPSPIFTSDADALAAAVEVYKKFEAASDAIGRDGGANPERIKPYVSQAGYEFELSQAKKYVEENSRGVGAAVLNNAKLQSYREQDGVARVAMYVCEDISNVDRIDASGRSLVGPDREDYVDYEVVLEGRSREGLVILSNDFWTGGGICKF